MFCTQFQRHPSHVISAACNSPPYSFMTLVAGQDKSRLALLCGSQFPGSQLHPRCQRGFDVPQRHLAVLPRSYTPTLSAQTGLALGDVQGCCRFPLCEKAASSPADARAHNRPLNPNLRRPKTTFPDAGPPPLKAASVRWIQRMDKQQKKKSCGKEAEVLPSSAAAHAR